MIGTNLEGVPELIADGETGLLVPPRNPEAMAQAMLRMVENPTRARAMARAGRKRRRGALLHGDQARAHPRPLPPAPRGPVDCVRSTPTSRPRPPTIACSIALVPYLKPYWHLLVIGGVFALVVAATEGLTAWLVKPAMDDIFLKRDLLMLKLLPLALLGVYLLKGGGRFGQSYLMASVGERVIARIRRELYAHIQGMPLAFFASLHSADLMSRVVTDVNRLARLSSTVLVMAVRQAGTIVALLVVMFSREWVLTLIAVAIFPLAGVTIRAIGKKLYKINKRSQQKIAELNVVLQESFTGTKIVKAFGREALEQQRFNDVNDRLMRLALKDHRTDQLAEPLMEVMGALGLMGALWYGGFQVISGRADPGGVLLLHRRRAPALRPRAPALAHGQYRAAVTRLRRARLSDPRHAPGHRGRPGRDHAAGLSRPARLRGRVVLLSGDDGAGAARHLARDAQGRARGLRRHVGRGQDHADGSPPPLSRRDVGPHHRRRRTTCARSPSRRCAA